MYTRKGMCILHPADVAHYLRSDGAKSSLELSTGQQKRPSCLLQTQDLIAANNVLQLSSTLLQRLWAQLSSRVPPCS
ncbi:hypothetical protein DIPPA_06952 [Diplonema papillatum]|nr:hypothetical protein DIPPA_06952 [Diplonema papillatum]